MKTNLWIASLLALVAAPAAAQAEDYGSPGQIEVGGSFGILSFTETEKPEGGDETETDTTAILMEPTVGYFIADGFELLGQMSLLNGSFKTEGEDTTTVTNIGLGA